MNENEVIEYVSNRSFNIKTNNYIFTNCLDFEVADNIPDISSVSFYQYDYDIATDYLVNIKIDFKQISVHNILSYILNYLKKLNLIDENVKCNVEFNSRLDIRKLQKVLRNYNKVIQIICFNLETLEEDKQKLFNELYYFNSPFYCVISFVKSDFKTYFLTEERVLDYRENYTKIELENKKSDEVKLKKVKL